MFQNLLKNQSQINCQWRHAKYSEVIGLVKYSKIAKPDDTEKDRSKKYSKTVLLPKSTFPLRHTRALELNPNNDISVANFVKLGSKPRIDDKFTLHDGPPYANGSLHFGHAINKFLKDMICRRKLLEGYDVRFRPGWDCHGLPIELKAVSSDFQTMNPTQVRQNARQLAVEVIDEHKNYFKHWSLLGDWSQPYFTFDNFYVENQINIFSELLDKGLLFRDYMPVYWSPSARTALAEAELQYNEQHISQSVFVKFKLNRIPESIAKFASVSALIWTTTPWTLPANQAIAFSSKFEYCLITIDSSPDEHLLIAKDLIPNLEKVLNSKLTIKAVIKGSELSDATYDNPIGVWKKANLTFLESSHVTGSKGTGLVHIAPNHGLDDYKLAVKSNIPVIECIVDESGRYVDTNNPLLDHKFVLSDGNEAIIKLLAKDVIFKHDYTHSYPYDWRYNEPVIVRASPQWFLDMELIRNDCMNAIDGATFYPQFYREYLVNQLKVRPNWCISRQRAWGVPIPVFFHKEDAQSRTPLTSKPILVHLAKLFGQHGPDLWWGSNVSQLVPIEMIESHLKTSVDNLVKGKDIFDIWFDSGISWTVALEEPKMADLYLEGYDQLRGWFQSSLILSVALRKTLPFKAVKIHGFALDSENKKMSKSVGNVIDPNSYIESNCGSDGFRWWVAKHASDHKDQRIASEHFDETLVNINRIRLTLRFMIGVIKDFDSSNQSCSFSELTFMDKYLLHLLHHYLNDINAHYEDHKLDKVIEKSLNFVVIQMSAFYFTRIRHRLYCDHKHSLRRRSSLTTISYLYHSIVTQLAPILPHIMTEANNHLPIKKDFTVNKEEWDQTQVAQDMKLIISMTDLINKELFGKNLIEFECCITSAHSDCFNILSKLQSDCISMDSELCEMLLVSRVVLGGMGSSESAADQTNGICLDGFCDQINYQLSITSANNYLCCRCRRYTAISETEVCEQCSSVLELK